MEQYDTQAENPCFGALGSFLIISAQVLDTPLSRFGLRYFGICGVNIDRRLVQQNLPTVRGGTALEVDVVQEVQVS